jgi:hypothetical protein
LDENSDGGGGGGGPAAAPAAVGAKKAAAREAALEYNARRAGYRRQVSALRRRYAGEVAAQRAADRAEREALERELTRRRLERQRRKNVRSARGAAIQEQRRRARASEFQEHLDRMQELRDADADLRVRARQLVVDELEKEAGLWLTTHDEVESAFSPEAEQLLWARPGGVVGAPNPSLDSHFWHLETHTWHMERTYPSQREVLLERLEDAAYDEANVDPAVWTPERVGERRRLEDRARLRAMVQSAGRLELLRRQRQMLLSEDEPAPPASGADGGVVPKPAPVPSLRMLRNRKALEQEGARLLMEDPTKFFVFEGTREGDAAASDDGFQDASLSSPPSGYSGPSLGAPVGLRDPLRGGAVAAGPRARPVYPAVIGRIPRPDARSEREKKQQEREDRMWAAAQADKVRDAAGGDREIELAVQQRTLDDLEPDLDYDSVEWDWQDDEWKKGLDPVADAAILNVPREERYTEEDIEWVASQLDAKVKHLEQQLRYDLDNLKHSAAAATASSGARGGPAAAAAGREEGGDAGSEAPPPPPPSDPGLEAALLALSDRELLELSDLDDRYSEGGMTEQDVRDAAAAGSIAGLSPDQVVALLRRDRTAQDS